MDGSSLRSNKETRIIDVNKEDTTVSFFKSFPTLILQLHQITRYIYAMLQFLRLNLRSKITWVAAQLYIAHARAAHPRDHNLEIAATVGDQFYRNQYYIGPHFCNKSRCEIGSFTSLSDREPRRTARRRSLRVAR